MHSVDIPRGCSSSKVEVSWGKHEGERGGGDLGAVHGVPEEGAPTESSTLKQREVEVGEDDSSSGASPKCCWVRGSIGGGSEMLRPAQGEWDRQWCAAGPAAGTGEEVLGLWRAQRHVTRGHCWNGIWISELEPLTSEPWKASAG